MGRNHHAQLKCTQNCKQEACSNARSNAAPKSIQINSCSHVHQGCTSRHVHHGMYIMRASANTFENSLFLFGSPYLERAFANTYEDFLLLFRACVPLLVMKALMRAVTDPLTAAPRAVPPA
eukprot:1160198-Pelagomonas_calceolata.AAC.7